MNNCIICLFEPHCNTLHHSWYIPRVFFYQYLPIDKKMKNSFGIDHHNIPIKFLHQCFRLYLLIF